MLAYTTTFTVSDLQLLKVLITEKILEAGRDISTEAEQIAFANNPLHEKLKSVDRTIETIINSI
jgi:hypothetical protein